MIEAVIFDLDGVLVSTDEYHYRSWVKIAAEEGFDFFDHKFNDQFRGVARMECVEILTKASGRDYSPAQKQEIADRKNGYFAESLSSVTPEELLPGALAMLQELRKRGIKIAVAMQRPLSGRRKLSICWMSLLTDTRSRNPSPIPNPSFLLQLGLALRRPIALLSKMPSPGSRRQGVQE
jgi:beta-phosphoglucomutase-like phosphatase (HAD superfamily)